MHCEDALKSVVVLLKHSYQIKVVLLNHSYQIQACSSYQIIEIQLQLLVTLYYFKQVLLTYLTVVQEGKNKREE